MLDEYFYEITTYDSEIWKRYIESVSSLMVSINLVNNIKHKYYGRY